MRVLQIAAGATVTLQDLTLTKGIAEFGGGIFNDGTVILRDAAVTGSAVSNQGGGIYTNGDLTLEAGCRVAGNTSISEGGGIRSNGGTTTLKAGCQVAGNSAGLGGGILNGATLTLEDGSVVGGSSPDDANASTVQDGGGIYNIGTLTLQGGSRVAGNSAANNGGGIHNTDASTTTLMPGSRVSGNTATAGGGIFNIGNMVTLEAGALVCGNSAPQCTGPLAGPGTCPVAADVCPPA